MAARRARRDPDFLEEMIAEETRRNPDFPKLLEAAVARRKLLRRLVAEREKAGISQTDVASRMKTSQSAVARLEAGHIDAKISTVDRFAAALGRRVEWRVVTTRRKRSKTAADRVERTSRSE